MKARYANQRHEFKKLLRLEKVYMELKTRIRETFVIKKDLIGRYFVSKIIDLFDYWEELTISFFYKG